MIKVENAVFRLNDERIVSVYVGEASAQSVSYKK